MKTTRVNSFMLVLPPVIITLILLITKFFVMEISTPIKIIELGVLLYLLHKLLEIIIPKWSLGYKIALHLSLMLIFIIAREDTIDAIIMYWEGEIGIITMPLEDAALIFYFMSQSLYIIGYLLFYWYRICTEIGSEDILDANMVNQQ